MRRGIVVVSRSCPPDIGGYQRQFALLLPRLAEGATVVGVSATRQRPTSRPGWPSVPTTVVPAHLVPRRARGAVDPVVATLAFARGVLLRGRTRARTTLLLLSPSMVGSRMLVALWTRLIGDVVLRFAGAGDARRLRPSARPRGIVAAVPGPSQMSEAEALGVRVVHVPNAVMAGSTSDRGRQIVVIGRLIATKRVDLILSAWEKVAPRHPAWRLTIIGSGQTERDRVEEQLRRQVHDGGLSRVEFLGEIHDPWGQAGSAGLFVTASEREGSPNAVLEALARGVAVVAPEGAMAEWFRPTPPHAAFEGGATGLAKILDELLTDDFARHELGTAGSAFIRRNHTVEQVQRRWVDLLLPVRETRLRGGWAKVRLDVAPDDLVLDVGSGRFPNPRADVLCERFPVRENRLSVVDRPFVVADAQALPFRTGSFGLAMATHLVEHVDDPVSVVAELARVGREGYVETPHRRFERLLPEENHRWALAARDGSLVCERNIWSAATHTTSARRLRWLYYAGESKPYPTLLLRGVPGRALRVVARTSRGLLNRTGITTVRYRFGSRQPPHVVMIEGRPRA